jgi:hypothetical protein
MFTFPIPAAHLDLMSLTPELAPAASHTTSPTDSLVLKGGKFERLRTDHEAIQLRNCFVDSLETETGSVTLRDCPGIKRLRMASCALDMLNSTVGGLSVHGEHLIIGNGNSIEQLTITSSRARYPSPRPRFMNGELAPLSARAQLQVVELHGRTQLTQLHFDGVGLRLELHDEASYAGPQVPGLDIVRIAPSKR